MTRHPHYHSILHVRHFPRRILKSLFPCVTLQWHFLEAQRHLKGQRPNNCLSSQVISVIVPLPSIFSLLFKNLMVSGNQLYLPGKPEQSSRQAKHRWANVLCRVHGTPPSPQPPCVFSGCWVRHPHSPEPLIVLGWGYHLKNKQRPHPTPFSFMGGVLLTDPTASSILLRLPLLPRRVPPF